MSLPGNETGPIKNNITTTVSVTLLYFSAHVFAYARTVEASANGIFFRATWYCEAICGRTVSLKKRREK